MKALQQTVSPALRFKDEQGNSYPSWGDKAFSCIAEKVNESYNPKNESKSLDCIELESLSSNSGLLLRTFKSRDQKSTKTKFLAGDVLFGKLRPYLRKYYLSDFEGVCTTEIWVLRPKSVPSEFLYYLVQSHQFNRVANIQSGTRMPRSDWGMVSRSVFKIPNDREELQKIGSFLSSVDRKIEQLINKKELLEQYKKGMMQKLFSQEIRFKDERGQEYPEWESKRFLELFKVQPSRKYQIKNSEIKPVGQYRVVDQGKKLVAGYSNEREKLFLTDGLIVYGDHTTIVKFIDFNFIVGADGTKILKPKGHQNIKFLYFCLDFYNISAEGYKRHFSIVKKLLLLVPSLEEQQKIASFLSSIDRKIELVDEQIKLTQIFKKGLLQQMFV